MTLRIFGVHDEKSGIFAHPFFCLATGQALRMFEDWVKGDTPLSKHPADYKLYELGTFDDNSAEFSGIVPPRYLATGSDFVVPVDAPKLSVSRA